MDTTESRREDVDRLAHHICDTTELDPVGVERRNGHLWVITGRIDGVVRLRIILGHTHDGQLRSLVAFDPDNHVHRLRADGVL